jgi:hypothetical protein
VGAAEMFSHVRVQFPVGHGFFHAGAILWGAPFFDFDWPCIRHCRPPHDVNKRIAFLYVYDCGSMQKSKAAREREIKRFHELTGKRKIDILFISHAHADHLNGVEMLLGGVNVDTIIMPFFTQAERLFALSKTLAESDGGDAPTDFYLQFITNPAAAMSELGARQVISVRKGDGPAPETDPDIGSPDGAPKWPEDRDGEGDGIGCRIIGKGKCATDPNNKMLFDVDDSCGLGLTIAKKIKWLLLPYVDPEVEKQSDNFYAKLKTFIPDLDEKIKTAVEIKSLIKDHANDLKQACKDATKLLPKHGDGINITSLCLYSGAANPDKAVHRCFRQCSCMPCHPPCWPHGTDEMRTAWLATGDAGLGCKKRRTAFLTFYDRYLSTVSTFTLPHHGSKGNYHSDLIQKIKPALCIATAPSGGKKKCHPNPAVKYKVKAEMGKDILVVTDDEDTAICECFCFGPA